jgi:hypothetical protein
VVVRKKKSSAVELSMMPLAIADWVPAVGFADTTVIAQAFAVEVPASVGREVPRVARMMAISSCKLLAAEYSPLLQ